MSKTKSQKQKGKENSGRKVAKRARGQENVTIDLAKKSKTKGTNNDVVCMKFCHFNQPSNATANSVC